MSDHVGTCRTCDTKGWTMSDQARRFRIISNNDRQWQTMSGRAICLLYMTNRVYRNRLGIDTRGTDWTTGRHTDRTTRGGPLKSKSSQKLTPSNCSCHPSQRSCRQRIGSNDHRRFPRFYGSAVHQERQLQACDRLIDQ